MTLLFAHRGASAQLPENTLEAFDRAVADGADVLESDVHLSRDGIVVMAHDDDGRRMAGVDQPIASSSLSELKKWNVGFGFVDDSGARPFVAKPLRMPTLAEALNAFPTTAFNLDVKQVSPPMIGALLNVIEKAGASERVLLASFYQSTLDDIRRRGYGGQTSFCRNEVVKLYGLPAAVLDTMRWLRGQRVQIPVHAGPLRFDSRRFIDKCHALSIAVDYWTIDDEAEAQRLSGLGADGIMTNRPGRLRAVISGEQA